MRALIQRVSQASVTVEEQTISSIGKGLLILLGVGHGDGEEQVTFLAEKTANLRIFEDEQGKTNLSILDVKGEAIVVSQFTLYANTQKGRRPFCVLAYNVNCETTIASPFTSKIERFVFHCSSSKIRRLAVFSARN